MHAVEPLVMSLGSRLRFNPRATEGRQVVIALASRRASESLGFECCPLREMWHIKGIAFLMNIKARVIISGIELAARQPSFA